ncbi:MAG: hypothetical protein EBV83_09120, partial [Verrucomicrobia bacterium]|nr:hypothetical protein [Verrucomicrobiota bacterium]
EEYPVLFRKQISQIHLLLVYTYPVLFEQMHGEQQLVEQETYVLNHIHQQQVVFYQELFYVALQAYLPFHE